MKTYRVLKTPIWDARLKVGDTFQADLSQELHDIITTEGRSKSGGLAEVVEAEDGLQTQSKPKTTIKKRRK